MSFGRHKVGFISSFLLDIYLRVELLNHIFSFIRDCNAKHVSQVVVLVNSPKVLYFESTVFLCNILILGW